MPTTTATVSVSWQVLRLTSKRLSKYGKVKDTEA